MPHLTIDEKGSPRFTDLRRLAPLSDLDKARADSVDAAIQILQHHAEHVARGYGASCMCGFAKEAIYVAAGLQVEAGR